VSTVEALEVSAFDDERRAASRLPEPLEQKDDGDG
jgi:hypothetical protein